MWDKQERTAGGDRYDNKNKIKDKNKKERRFTSTRT
jgi:hypothetical protein